MLPNALNNFFHHNHRNRNTDRSRSKAKVFPKFDRIKITQQLFKYKGYCKWKKASSCIKKDIIFEIFYQISLGSSLLPHEELI